MGSVIRNVANAATTQALSWVETETRSFHQAVYKALRGIACLVLLGSSGHALAQLPPVLATNFNPSPVALGATTSLTFTITNPAANAVALTGVAFSDTLPTGLTVPNASATVCGGTVTLTNPTTITMTNATIGVGTPCVFSITVTGAAAGSFTNTAGPITSTNGGTGNLSSANLIVANPPTITKLFGAAAIPLNGTTSLTFNINNPNPATGLTGVAFTDNLPSGLVVAGAPGVTSNCGGTFTAVAGAGVVSLSGGTLATSAGCTISVNIQGTTSGIKNNSTQVTSNEGGTGNTTTTSITVVAPPVIIKVFGAASIPLGGSTSLSFIIQNNNTTIAASGVAFTDTLPAGLVVSTPNGLAGSCGAGTITATAGSATVTLTGGTIAVSASCTFSINVTGTAAGTQNNTTGTVSSTEGGTGGTASSGVNVQAPPVIAKVFNPSPIAVGGTTALTFTITNPAANAAALTGVGFTDTLPTGLTVPNASATVCGGIISLTNPTSISLTGATISPGAPCVFSVTVTGVVAGNFTNTTGNVTSTNGGTGNNASANLTVNPAPPVIIKAFGASSIPLNGTTSLTFTIQNNNAGNALSAIAFSDTLPAGLVVATPNGLTGSCGGGTITAVAGAGSVSLAGASLAASTSCTFSVNVTGTSGGQKNNTTSQVTATESGAGGTASASLNVVAPPTIGIAFNPAAINTGATTSLTFTITNPAANPVALTGVGFSDTLPTGLTVSNTSATVCGGTLALTAPTGIALAGGTIAVNTQCVFSVTVTGATAGNYTNTTSADTSTNGGTGNTGSATLTVGAADLTIAKSHTGVFTPGQTGATYTLTVSNSGAGPTLGTVTVVDTLPAVSPTLAPTAMAGTGWTCTLATLTCTRADALAPGASYPPITLTVNVPAGMPSSFANTAAVSGGGETNTANDTATDPTVIVTTSFTGPTPSNGTATASFTGGGPTCSYTRAAFIPVSGGAGSPPAGTAPPNFTFPDGLFDFATAGCTPGSALSFTITYATPLPAGTVYWKFGPTASAPTPHWYQLPATIAGNTATFTISDGGQGDDDLAPNGDVVDQGGPGVPAPGAGGLTQVPTLSEWAMMLLAASIVLLGMLAVRRRAALR